MNLQKINSWLQETESNFNLLQVNNLVQEACKCYSNYIKLHAPKPLVGKIVCQETSIEVVCIPRKEDENMCDVLIYDADKAAFFDAVMKVFNMDVTYFEKKLETAVSFQSVH